MDISSTGIDLIKNYESCNLSVYGDANGYPTVGWGHLLSTNVYKKNANLSKKDADKELKKAGLSYTSPISQTQADSLLKKDLKTAEKKVNSKDDDVYNKLNQNQFDALTSLTFNAPKALSSDDMNALLDRSMTFSDYGAPISDSEKKTMAKMVTAAFQWTKANGKQQRGLVKRRNDEMALFCKGMRYSYNKIVYKE